MTKQPEWDPAAAVQAMATMVDGLKILSETARGYHAMLVGQGWPEPLADDLAAELLQGMQAQLFAGGRR